MELEWIYGRAHSGQRLSYVVRLLAMPLEYQVDDKTNRIYLTERHADRIAHSKIPVWDGTLLIGKIELSPDGKAELIFDQEHKPDRRFRLDEVTVVEDRIVSVDLRWL